MYSISQLPRRNVSLFGGADLFGFNNGRAASADQASRERGFQPPLDIAETADGYEVRVELPGVNKKDLSVNIADNLLTIEAESHDESAQQEGTEILKSERCIGKQYRALRLGKLVDEDSIQAEYKDGVLKITLSRVAEAKPKSVAVEVH